MKLSKGKIVLLVVCCVLVLEGCVMKKKTYETEKEILGEVKRYMKEKYNQRFELYGYDRFLWSRTFTVHMSAVDNEIPSVVEIQFDMDKGVVSDDYSAYMYKYEIDLFINEEAKAIFGTEIACRGGLDGVLEAYPQKLGLSIDEVLDTYPLPVYVGIYLDENVHKDKAMVKKQVQKLYSELQKKLLKNSTFSITVYVCRSDSYKNNKDLIDKARKEKMSGVEYMNQSGTNFRTYIRYSLHLEEQNGYVLREQDDYGN